MSESDPSNPSIDDILRASEAMRRPYEGEVHPPVTLLDKTVLEFIEMGGDDNVPHFGPYLRPGQRRILEPAAEVVSVRGEPLQFGSDYMTHVFDLPATAILPAQKVTCVYNKKYALARVVVDGFVPEGGLSYRTTFSAYQLNIDQKMIQKSRQTDFSGHRTLSGFPFQDFQRDLKNNERDALTDTLLNPRDTLTQIEIFAKLAGETQKEAKLAERNRKEHDNVQDEYRGRMDAIARSHRIPPELLYRPLG